MRSEKEIREQIEKSMDAVKRMTFCEEREFISNQIDALLWVIDDKSGTLKTIYGEVG